MSSPTQKSSNEGRPQWRPNFTFGGPATYTEQALDRRPSLSQALASPSALSPKSLSTMEYPRPNHASFPCSVERQIEQDHGGHPDGLQYAEQGSLRIRTEIQGQPIGPSSPLAQRSSPTPHGNKGSSMASVTRSMLLSGVPSHEAAHLGAAASPRTLPALSPGSASSETIHEEIIALRDRLRHWGPIYLGNSANADVLIRAVSLRRTSEASLNKQIKDPKTEDGPSSTPRRLPEQHSRNQIVVRACVRPRRRDRRPFLLQRRFDIDDLRATIPDHYARGGGHWLTTASSRRASSISELGSAGPDGPRSPSNSVSQLIGSARRRSTSARLGPVPPRGARTNQEGKVPHQDSNTMPIHLEYARSYLPVAAALLLSGYVREGDTIELPVPKPEAWTQSVAYVYTGKGPLAKEAAENILYLGGKV